MKVYNIILILLLIIFAACTDQEKILKLEGAGATFPYPLYAEMFRQYHNLTGVEVEYQAIGSGAGIKLLSNKKVDFGASDAFIEISELKNTAAEIVHIPVCKGAVAVSYNLPDIANLRLSPALISKIFRQEITQWNDPHLKELNPELALPALQIVPLHRSDASGTTFIFTEFLTQTDIEWQKSIGKGLSVDWIAGFAAKGNQGIADKLAEQPGAISYLEYNYTITNELAAALIQNQAGNFVQPHKNDLKSGENSDLEMHYPLTGFSWILVHEELQYLKHKAKAYNLLKLIWWMTHEGQELTVDTQYTPLPEEQIQKSEKLLRSIKFKGKNILK